MRHFTIIESKGSDKHSLLVKVSKRQALHMVSNLIDAILNTYKDDDDVKCSWKNFELTETVTEEPRPLSKG